VVLGCRVAQVVASITRKIGALEQLGVEMGLFGVEMGTISGQNGSKSSSFAAEG